MTQLEELGHDPDPDWDTDTDSCVADYGALCFLTEFIHCTLDCVDDMLSC